MLLKYFQYESANVGQDADDSKQVFKDAYGQRHWCARDHAASEFSFVKQTAMPAENEGTVVSNSSTSNGMTAAQAVKKSREDREQAAAIEPRSQLGQQRRCLMGGDAVRSATLGFRRSSSILCDLMDPPGFCIWIFASHPPTIFDL